MSAHSMRRTPMRRHCHRHATGTSYSVAAYHRRHHGHARSTAPDGLDNAVAFVDDRPCGSIATSHLRGEARRGDEVTGCNMGGTGGRDVARRGRSPFKADEGWSCTTLDPISGSPQMTSPMRCVCLARTSRQARAHEGAGGAWWTDRASGRRTAHQSSRSRALGRVVGTAVGCAHLM